MAAMLTMLPKDNGIGGMMDNDTCAHGMGISAEYTTVTKAGQLNQHSYVASLLGSAQCGLTFGHQGRHQSNILVFNQHSGKA